eukprot:3294701-Pleurochrysis_carterae.AAC.4
MKKEKDPFKYAVFDGRQLALKVRDAAAKKRFTHVLETTEERRERESDGDEKQLRFRYSLVELPISRPPSSF